MSTYDAVIVGAGVSGLAAAARLRQAGRRVLVLEGRDRIGGRAFTDERTFGRPFDHGCHWLHSPGENPLTRLAEAHGFACGRDVPHAVYADGVRLAKEAERALADHRERTFAAIRSAGGRGTDVPVADLIDRDDPLALHTTHAFTSKMGIEPRRASTLDFALYRWVGEDRPVRDGFGALLYRHFAAVPVTLCAAVRRIEWAARGARVTSDAGAVETASVLVTVSTGVLRAEAIEFAPRLPGWKLAALEGVPMARAIKVGVELTSDGIGLPGPAFLTLMRGREAIDVEVWPTGWNGVTCYLDGDLAAGVDDPGGRAAEDLAVGMLVDTFGSAVRGAVRASLTTRWNHDPFTRGTYSAPLPGHARARADLARPLDGRVHFAGEATSIAWSGDVHGAYQSGLDAADAILGGAPPA